MRKFIGIVLTMVMLTALSGCGSLPAEKVPEETDKPQEEVKYSDNILLSLNNGAPGFGTRAECTDAEIFIYTDGTIKVIVYYPEELEIASLELSQEDYEELYELADRKKISKLKVKDGEAADGSSYYITLYDENDEELLYKGGYMPVGKAFWEMYDGIKEILKPYGISEIVVDYRKSIEE